MPPKTASSCTAFSKDSITSLADVVRNGSRPAAGHSLDMCATHAELQHQIHRDLKRWRDTPISEAAMRRAIDDPAFTLTVAVHAGDRKKLALLEKLGHVALANNAVKLR